MVAVRGGKRSPQSAVLAASTVTPPVSQARLQGRWNVHVKQLRRLPGSRNGTDYWHVIPACAAVVCHLVVHVKTGKYPFELTMTRAGAVYRGHVTVGFIPCGRPPNSIPDPTVLTFRVHATDAVGKGQEWVATSFAGIVVGTSKYVSSAAFYCPASKFTAALRGTPS